MTIAIEHTKSELENLFAQDFAHPTFPQLAEIYLEETDIEKAIDVLNAIQGVDSALSKDEAVAKFDLNAERIGQIVVNGSKDTVFGNTAEIDLPIGLRSHGSEHERKVPIIGYNLKNKEFQFSENRDIGIYVINEFGI